VLKPNGSIWVSGTAHVIHSVGFAMQQLGFKLLNDISWVKPNPPPNLSCRYFTHATETIIWAAKDKKSRHTFNYKLMKEINRGKQMKSVWTIPPPEPWEKKFGKHPTQKPVALLERILLASTNEGDLVLDPFAGSGTTLLAAFRLRRNAVACELDAQFLALSARRLCSNLVQLEISIATVQFSVDPPPDPMDRSCSGRSSDRSASASERSGSCSARFPKRAGLCSGRGPSRAALRSTATHACPEHKRRGRARSIGEFKNVVIPSVAEGPAFRSFAVDLELSTIDRMPPQLQLVQQERRYYFIGRTKREILFTVLADSLDEARQKFRNAGNSDSDALFIIKTETEIYLA
jgi:hypothetical protein